MDIKMIITERHIQFNLSGTDVQEKAMLQILKNFEGSVTIQKGIDVFQTKSGFISGIRDPECVLITIDKHRATIEDEHSKLLNAVEDKVEGQSRFETALRLIQQGQNSCTTEDGHE
jgi:hypothetical protein